MNEREVIIDYLKRVESALNGTPFLFHFSLDSRDSEGCNAKKMFDYLLVNGILKKLLKDYNGFINNPVSGINGEYHYLYREKLLELNKDKIEIDRILPTSIRVTEVTKNQFRLILLSTLSDIGIEDACFQFTALDSHYHKNLSLVEASVIIDKIEIVLKLNNGEKWRYFYFNPYDFDIKIEENDFYFWRMYSDCCVVFHDEKSNFYILLTTGTD